MEKSYYTKFNWQTALFARGSGASVDGQIKYTRGFYPDTANWATGLSLSFSPTEIFSLRARKKIERFNFTAEQARYDETLQKLKAQDSRAKTMLEAARKLAADTPLQLKAAQFYMTLQVATDNETDACGQRHAWRKMADWH